MASPSACSQPAVYVDVDRHQKLDTFRVRTQSLSCGRSRPLGGQLNEIGNLIRAGHVKPVIDKVFPFDQAKVALDYLAQGRAKGKVVVHIKQDQAPA
nr:zinc-binding dehydrogenase [Pseudomonas sp. St316]